MENLMQNKRMAIALLAIFTFTTFFLNNHALNPDIMEMRNLITAHEMVEDGHWMVPMMNGEYRLEKPPLPTWVAACVEAVFGDSLPMQRAAAGLMAVVLCSYLYLLLRRMSNKTSTALVGTLMLMTCYNIILQGRTATWDIYCHAFMMGAIYHLHKAWYNEQQITRNFCLAGCFMGLSFMSKGPVSFFALLLPSLIAFLWHRRPNMRNRWKGTILMVSTCLILSAWWYAYTYLMAPEATTFVVNKESTSWVNHNVRPWWYYWRFFLETGIWAPLLLWVMYKSIRYWSSCSTETKVYLVWTLSGVVLLSLFPEKKMRYLLPLMMPCCMLMADWISHNWKSGTIRKLLGGVCILFFMVECFGLPFVGRFMGYTHRTSLKEVRPMVKAHPQLPVYYVENESHKFRIDMVYHVGTKVKSITEAEADSLLQHSNEPALLLTAPTYTPSTLHTPQLQLIGTFDNNLHAEKSKHYKSSLVNKAWWFTPAEE